MKQFGKLASQVLKTLDQCKTRASNTRVRDFSYNDVDKFFHVDIEFIKLAFKLELLKLIFLSLLNTYNPDLTRHSPFQTLKFSSTLPLLTRHS